MRGLRDGVEVEWASSGLAASGGVEDVPSYRVRNPVTAVSTPSAGVVAGDQKWRVRLQRAMRRVSLDV